MSDRSWIGVGGQADGEPASQADRKGSALPYTRIPVTDSEML